MGVLIFFMLAFGALVFVPLLLLKLVFSLAFLPFRLVGLAFRLVFGALGGIFRVGFGLVGLVGASWPWLSSWCSCPCSVARGRRLRVASHPTRPAAARGSADRLTGPASRSQR